MKSISMNMIKLMTLVVLLEGHAAVGACRIVPEKLYEQFSDKVLLLQLRYNVQCEKLVGLGASIVCSRAETVEQHESCFRCASKRMLFNNICSCDLGMHFCLMCIEQLALKNAVALEFKDNGAYIDFMLRIPQCPYCSKSYCDVAEISRLKKILTTDRLKVIAVANLADKLQILVKDGRLPFVVDLLVKHNSCYVDMMIRDVAGVLLSVDLLAFQLVEKNPEIQKVLAGAFPTAVV